MKKYYTLFVKGRLHTRIVVNDVDLYAPWAESGIIFTSIETARAFKRRYADELASSNADLRIVEFKLPKNAKKKAEKSK